MKRKILISILLISILSGCKKLLEIPNPDNIRTPALVFATEESANEAIAGVYRSWQSLYNSVISPTILSGLTADELQNYSVDPDFEQFENNNISPTNTYLPWASLYNIIYQANAAMEGLNNSTALSIATKNYYLGEAKFIRAYAYFTLVNFFGEVPLLTSTDLTFNQNAGRSGIDDVYLQIENDLLESETLMGTNIFEGDHRFRVNKLIVSAFLARVYLFRKDWSRAEARANQVINAGRYQLVSDLDSITKEGNAEALFQFDDNGLDGIVEAQLFIFGNSPLVVLTEDIINAFESNDLRKEHWISSKLYQNTRYYFPYKYKLGNFAANERYTLFRLAEQYLIRSEACANQNKLEESVTDINIIRGRVNLPLINSDISIDSCMSLIRKERRLEFFAETSHRWFDLKRHEKVSEVISGLKPSWQAFDMLYPLPNNDIIRNRNLSQNPGYN